MDYYKLINGKNIVGAVSLNDFRKYQAKHGLVLFSDIENAQYVEFKGVYYRDNWLRSTTTNAISFQEASIVRINESEYNTLLEAFETYEEVSVQQNDETITNQEDTQTINDNDVATIEFIRDAKIAQMNKQCHQIIVNGIDVILSDGESHHFSLEVEDQIKIQSLALKAQSGEEILFWHEDGKPCQFYLASDILLIYRALEEIQTYQTTYYNSLKIYIMSLDNIEDINAVYYGMEIPLDYQSEVLKYLIGLRGTTNEENNN